MSDKTAEAKQLLSNTAFTDALESVRQQAFNAALGCDVKDDEGRRRYLDAVRTVDKVRAHLIALIANDQPEGVEIDFYAERAKRRLFGLLGPHT